MMKKLAGLIVLAAIVAACTDSATGPRPSPGGAMTPTPSVISMSPSVAVAGIQITFTSQGLVDREDYTRNWDFGDGARAEGLSVTHVYQSSGVYDVVLSGCDGTRTRTALLAVSVAPAGPGTLPPPQEIRLP